MTTPNDGRMIPSATDAATLTLAATWLIAPDYRRGPTLTPEGRRTRAVDAVDAVMEVWDEVTLRITNPTTKPAP